MAKILCEICGEPTHSIQAHLKEAHTTWTIKSYTEKYPDAPLLSEGAKKIIKDQKVKDSVVSKEVDKAVGNTMRKIFNLGKSPKALSSSGSEIVITVLDHESDFSDLIPEVDERYIFPIDNLKNVLMGLEENIPTYLWGHAGVGKSTLFEQICAKTNRPYMRVQHTANTEESHIVGQILANETGTYFEPGPLTLAMKHGMVYNADEYDFAHASILAVYQPVLEGKSLVIKEAPKEWRVIKPHPNFRFVATGNTNGSGDEHAIYSGTNIGNAANYSRFGITDHIGYMPMKQEVAVVSLQAEIDESDANLLVKFAQEIRKAFDAAKMTMTIGPRELIFAAKVGLMKENLKEGVELAFINRLSPVDREISSGIAQRIFGTKHPDNKEAVGTYEW